MSTDETQVPRERVTRRVWQRSVRAPQFPRELRVIKATLITWGPLLTAEGILCRRPAELADAAGLPDRTVRWHLKRAADAGWFEHITTGGYNRRAVYAATVPADLWRQDVASSGAVSGGNALAPDNAVSGGNLVASSSDYYRYENNAASGDPHAVSRERGRSVVESCADERDREVFQLSRVASGSVALAARAQRLDRSTTSSRPPVGTQPPSATTDPGLTELVLGRAVEEDE